MNNTWFTLLPVATMFYFVVSWINAQNVGRCWKESTINTFENVVVWCGFFVSGFGFAWTYWSIIWIMLAELGAISEQTAVDSVNFGYVVFATPIITMAILFWLKSKQKANRDNTIASCGGISEWNKLIQKKSGISKLNRIPDSFGEIWKITEFSVDNEYLFLLQVGAKVVIICSSLCLLGMATSSKILKRSCKQHSKEMADYVIGGQ